jgi:hypothetical protein
MDERVNPDGSTTQLMPGDPSLPVICTVFRSNQGIAATDTSFRDSLMAIMQDPAFMLALNDFTATLEAPYRIRINCARAIEAIGHALSPGEENDKRRWEHLRATLNLTRDYLDPLSNESKGPRHGNYFEPSQMAEPELRVRAWTVMNRFIECLKRDKSTLPSSEFPIL